MLEKDFGPTVRVVQAMCDLRRFFFERMDRMLSHILIAFTILKKMIPSIYSVYDFVHHFSKRIRRFSVSFNLIRFSAMKPFTKSHIPFGNQLVLSIFVSQILQIFSSGFIMEDCAIGVMVKFNNVHFYCRVKISKLLVSCYFCSKLKSFINSAKHIS